MVRQPTLTECRVGFLVPFGMLDGKKEGHDRRRSPVFLSLRWSQGRGLGCPFFRRRQFGEQPNFGWKSPASVKSL